MTLITSTQPKPQPHLFAIPTVREIPRPTEPVAVAGQW